MRDAITMAGMVWHGMEIFAASIWPTVEECLRYAKWAGLRLPTETEWEDACRAATDTLYCTGDKEKGLDRAGGYWENSDHQIHSVGEKEPNDFGLYDLHGNVREWLEDDWHDNDDGAPNDGSAGSMDPGALDCLVRGGGWNGAEGFCRNNGERIILTPKHHFFSAVPPPHLAGLLCSRRPGMSFGRRPQTSM